MENKNNGSGKGVRIKVKKKYFNFKSDNIIMLMVTILVGMMSGIVASEFFVESAINGINNVTNINDARQVEDEAFTVRKVSSCLATISYNSDNVEPKGNKNYNVTGVVLDKEGYILTNYSNMKDFKDIYVKLASVSMAPIKGKLIGFDEVSDIALIKIEMEGITAIEIGEEEDLIEGNKVLAVGNSVSDEYIGIATPGIITSLNETVNNEDKSISRRLVQTNAIINKENTGGAIVNLKGELLGICSRKITDDKGMPGLFYGVGISEINDIVEGIIGNTNVLGIIGKVVTKEKDTDIEGFYVQGVEEGGIASEIGIKALDIILSIDGKEVRSLDDIYYVLKGKGKGEVVECIILRSGVEKDIKIYLK